MSGTSKFRSTLLRISERASAYVGNPLSFMVAGILGLMWVGVGLEVGFSRGWQIATSNGASILTFILVFLLQNSQNRQTRAFQLKLDEIIRATEGAKNSMVSLEKLSDEDLEIMSQQYHELAQQARKRIRSPKAGMVSVSKSGT